MTLIFHMTSVKCVESAYFPSNQDDLQDVTDHPQVRW